MTSMFESAVYARENQTPWARVSLIRFMSDMALNGTDQPLVNAVVLTAHYRHDVASRLWWDIAWTGADGERHEVTAQHLDKLLWRAAEIESRVEEQPRPEAGET